MKAKQTLNYKMSYRIQRKAEPVFVPNDFTDLSDYDQVLRILRKKVQEGSLIKLGQGIYTRARYSKFTNKQILEKPLNELARIALKKLGVKTAPTRFESAYNEGRTTQVPTGRVIGVKSRVNRKISYQGKSITFEKVA